MHFYDHFGHNIEYFFKVIVFLDNFTKSLVEPAEFFDCCLKISLRLLLFLIMKLFVLLENPFTNSQGTLDKRFTLEFSH